MNPSIQTFFFKIEIAWNLVWTVLLVTFYVCLFLNSFYQIPLNFDLVLAQYILQVIFFIAAILSLFIFILKRLDTSKQEETQSDLLSEGGRIVFPILSIIFYILNIFDFLRSNYSFLWLILPWLLWLPIIIDLSTQVKKEFSWIK